MTETMQAESGLFRVESDVRGDGAVVRFAGELDASTDRCAHEALASIARQGIQHFRIDMSDVTYVGSSGINVLSHLMAQHPLSIVTLVGTSALFKKMLRATGMDAHLALVS